MSDDQSYEERLAGLLMSCDMISGCSSASALTTNTRWTGHGAAAAKPGTWNTSTVVVGKRSAHCMRRKVASGSW